MCLIIQTAEIPSAECNPVAVLPQAELLGAAYDGVSLEGSELKWEAFTEKERNFIAENKASAFLQLKLSYEGEGGKIIFDASRMPELPFWGIIVDENDSFVELIHNPDFVCSKDDNSVSVLSGSIDSGMSREIDVLEQYFPFVKLSKDGQNSITCIYPIRKVLAEGSYKVIMGFGRFTEKTNTRLNDKWWQGTCISKMIPFAVKHRNEGESKSK